MTERVINIEDHQTNKYYMEFVLISTMPFYSVCSPLQESQDLLGRQSPESSMGLSHTHALPPKDIAAAWNLTPADMHKRVDAAAAFNNNSSYSTAFLNSNGFAGKLPGARPAASGQIPQPGQNPQAGHVPQGSQVPQVPFGNVHAVPFRPAARGVVQHGLPMLVCPLTKVIGFPFMGQSLEGSSCDNGVLRVSLMQLCNLWCMFRGCMLCAALCL